MIQLWDVESGKELTAIETNYGYRSSAKYFEISPDWKTIFVARDKRKRIREEKDGKVQYRWEFEGDIRSWDLATGQLRDRYAHQPPRGAAWISLSPDGKTILSTETVPDQNGYSPVMGLWDVQSKNYRQLPAKSGIFTPDGNTVAFDHKNDGSYSDALKLYDVATGQEKLSIPITQPFTRAGIATLSPDSTIVVGHFQTFPDAKTWNKWDSSWRFWDGRTGKEIASLDINGFFSAVSPDRRIVASTNYETELSSLYLIDVMSCKVAHTVDLGKDVRAVFPVFSNDGRWIAVRTQGVLKDQPSKFNQEMRPQPRLHLIEVATGKVQEVMILPRDSGSPAFSPDGKLLATSSQGEVHLWDVSDVTR